MENCVAAYIGNGQIVTKFYARTDIQKVKRSVLNINTHYDILNLDHIKEVVSKCNRTCISGISRRLTDGTFIFNYLIENGIDIKKLIILNTDQSFHLETSLTTSKEKVFKDLFDTELVITQERQVASELTIMAMESLHNLYWKNGRIVNWKQINEADKKKYNLYYSELTKKYGTTNLSSLFIRKQGKEFMYKFDIQDKEKYHKLKLSADRGFNAIIRAAASIEEGGHGVFLYYFETSNEEYWQLDNNEYYILKLNGLGYPLRYFAKKDVNTVLKSGGVQSIDEFELRENRLRFGQKFYKTLQYFKTKNMDITGTTNRMVLNLLKPLYNMSDDVHLYTCENAHIALAVRKTTSLTDILKKLSDQINDLGISNCFDSISIANAVMRPLGIDYFDTNNPMMLNLKYLNNIKNIKEDINGCDKQQVADLFSKLKE